MRGKGRNWQNGMDGGGEPMDGLARTGVVLVVYVEGREVEILFGRIAVVGEVGEGLRINGKGGRHGKLQAGGGEKVSSRYSWEGRNREMGNWKRSAGKTQRGEGMLEGIFLHGRRWE